MDYIHDFTIFGFGFFGIESFLNRLFLGTKMTKIWINKWAETISRAIYFCILEPCASVQNNFCTFGLSVPIHRTIPYAHQVTPQLSKLTPESLIVVFLNESEDCHLKLLQNH